MDFTQSFKSSFDRKGCTKFTKDSLAALQLIKTYNPKFIATFIVSQSRNHMSGDELKKFENMMTLKRRKEINAKYTDLLKSKPNLQKQTKAERTKGAKTKDDLNTQLRSPGVLPKNDKMDMKEIFKNSMYLSTSSSSMVNDIINTSIGHGKNFLYLCHSRFSYPSDKESYIM